ncbi:sulfite exporter TauE/SafE family protein [Pseudoalteromonas luteoviolacea]|uniref:Probable membrane transporter protein n=1 Tax=Pseudoalteromonas luteoviolacea S4054 TaxID=1129367 RepID=A0A0F6AI25_9GAMM|nr:sulfite exporter TauE/SafE family protein [Pseudoalteromonas luteoviolacea]AOT07881.1 permease [Pseudoalteromonas luteoviolacea]AOT12797.1 permease [Pseudoalteromonas luteoviolacea]AOT17710.1 permease [Pseudoalteromonas luteoviolacea]KKE85880.1 permease [Pseudoalteromonas luteoviolacea S4054]KZN74758.1 permease [Pseudoalteromonas luteoviolacea S4047-1]
MIEKLRQPSTWPLYFTLLIHATLIWMQGLSSAMLQVLQEIEIAATMALGSFVAGGTALGGGAVAFPVMTKVLNIEPNTAKVFSLAIQSFGMTAATITILCRRIPIYTNLVLLALPMSALGVVLSLMYVAPIAPRLLVKSIFSFLLLCFAMTMLLRWWRKAHHQQSAQQIQPSKLRFMAVAFVGGIASGLVGSGSDIALFALLVIAYNADIKKATATSVVVMAFTSLVGSAVNAWYLGTITPKIESYLLAAIPIVVVGAPLGAYVCSKVKVGQLVSFLLLLIVLEVSFTSYELWLGNVIM